FNLGFVGDVHRDADGVPAARVDLTRGRAGRSEVEVGNRDLRALAREQAGDFLADAARRAGDDRYLVLQTHVIFPCLPPASGQVIVDDLAEFEREIGDDVRAGDDLEDGELGERRQRVREQRELGRAGPRSLQVDVAQPIFDQLADARRAVDMWDDLEQEI